MLPAIEKLCGSSVVTPLLLLLLLLLAFAATSVPVTPPAAAKVTMMAAYATLGLVQLSFTAHLLRRVGGSALMDDPPTTDQSLESVIVSVWPRTDDWSTAGSFRKLSVPVAVRVWLPVPWRTVSFAVMSAMVNHEVTSVAPSLTDTSFTVPTRRSVLAS